jgi:bile acid:Na+ symporter, BASS family
VADILEVVLKISILVFMVGNMAGMGAQLAMAEALAALRNVRFVMMAVVWGWVLCPSFAYLLVKIIPMEEPYTIGLILVGMTPCAPFMPMMVRKARGDLSYTGALMLLAAIGTVAFMPFAVPRMVSGLTANAWVVGKPLLFFVLMPLLLGMAVRRCAESVASRLYPLVKKTTDITTMVMLAVMAIVYGKDFIGAIGSYAIGTLVLFVGVVTLATDRLGFGLSQGQRSVLTIGMCTRNLGAAIAPLMAIKADSRSVVMVALGIPVTLIFSFLAARWYASHAPPDEPAGRRLNER